MEISSTLKKRSLLTTMPSKGPDKPAPKLDEPKPEGTKNVRLRKKSEKVKLLYTTFYAFCLPIYTGGVISFQIMQLQGMTARRLTKFCRVFRRELLNSENLRISRERVQD
jgi:hypothetical protein